MDRNVSLKNQLLSWAFDLISGRIGAPITA